MEEGAKPPSDKSEEKKAKDAKWLTWLLLAIILLLLGVIVYLWLQLQACKDGDQKLQKDKQDLQAQVDKLKKDDQSSAQATTPTTQACNDMPTASLKENIKAALDSENTAAFASYFSNPVKFVLAASEKGGDETPDQAAVDMEYANSATGPWDFNLPAATVAHYDAGFYTDYFDANTYVGRAASGQVAAFDFDCNGKIKQAFLASNEDIL